MKTNIDKINGYIYVTSDDEIKKNNIYLDRQTVVQAHVLPLPDRCKKIILTNNPDLTTVQQLTLEEVNYLNSVNSCEVEKIDIVVGYRYKLLIPTEQPKYTEKEVKTFNTSKIMLNELEQKIRKAIPKLEILPMEFIEVEPIQLNHVLEYVKYDNKFFYKDDLEVILSLWNLKSNLLSEQSEQLIKFVNDLN